MDFITGQLRENGLADSPAGDSQMSSAIESALAGYTAKRLPPVVACLQNPNPCPCLFGRLGMICAIAKSSSLHPCREMSHEEISDNKWVHYGPFESQFISINSLRKLGRPSWSSLCFSRNIGGGVGANN